MNTTPSTKTATLKFSHDFVRKIQDTKDFDLGKVFPDGEKIYCDGETFPHFFELELGSYTFDDGVRAVLIARHDYTASSAFDDRPNKLLFHVDWYDANGKRIDKTKPNLEMKTRFFFDTRRSCAMYNRNNARHFKNGHERLDCRGHVTHILNVEDELPYKMVELEEMMNNVTEAHQEIEALQRKINYLTGEIGKQKDYMKMNGIDVDEYMKKLILK